jgi:hypothetical protein
MQRGLPGPGAAQAACPSVPRNPQPPPAPLIHAAPAGPPGYIYSLRRPFPYGGVASRQTIRYSE